MTIFHIASDQRLAPADEPPEPSGTRGPARYLREAIRIIRLDTDAMGRMAQDRRALHYGAAVMMVALAIQSLSELPALVETVPVEPLLLFALIVIIVPMELAARSDTFRGNSRRRPVVPPDHARGVRGGGRHRTTAGTDHRGRVRSREMDDQRAARVARRS